MDHKEYRIRGKELVDFTADYLESIRTRKVFPDKKPGFLRRQISESAPLEGEEWSKIFTDFENIILPGITHWQSPRMHAYFPALTSYPSMLGDMLSNAINCICFTWAASPACTELEVIVMNWLGKMIGLPEQFLHRKGGKGGGVIQTTASEATLVSLLAARWQAIKKYKEINPNAKNGEINSKLIAYCSDQAHSSVEKAALIGLVHIRYIKSDDNLSMRGQDLKQTIKKDRDTGLIPFWVCATLGTTGVCAFDNLEEIVSVCSEENMWVHVDAAYAGSAFICPEFRIWLKGVDKANSFAFNPSKWLLMHFDCTAMWVLDSTTLHEAFNVNPVYLQHEYSGLAIDFMHWQIPLSRRFRALKMWCVIRKYGIKNLQKHIREGVRLAQKFEALVRSDGRFEIPVQRHLGMVVFRLKGENIITETLLKRINSRGNIHCIPSFAKEKYIIRFPVTSPRTTNEDILSDWDEIKIAVNEILEKYPNIEQRAKIPLGDTKVVNESFGTSLLLSNSPNSPKIVNGSFAAIYDQSDVIAEFSKTLQLRQNVVNSPAMRRRIKGILMSGKQFSLDSRLDLIHGIEPLSLNKPNLDILEDASDNDETESINFDDGGSNSSLLQVPFQRSTRSKSVDHQERITFEKNSAKCPKCGHDIIAETKFD